jgi:hypothetical protein
MTEYKHVWGRGGMRNGSVGTNSFEKIVVTMYTIRCGITIQMLACAACLVLLWLLRQTAIISVYSINWWGYPIGDSLFTARLGSEILGLAPKRNILCSPADADIFTVCDVLGTTRSSWGSLQHSIRLLGVCEIVPVQLTSMIFVFWCPMRTTGWPVHVELMNVSHGEGKILHQNGC